LYNLWFVLTNYYTHNQLHQSEQTKDYTIVGVVDDECNSPSNQAKDYTIVGVVDYECNSSSEQPKDYTIVGVVTTPTIV
jgi:hypothetical protein